MDWPRLLIAFLVRKTIAQKRKLLQIYYGTEWICRRYQTWPKYEYETTTRKESATEAKRFSEQTWMTMFDKLVSYKTRHCHTRVPQGYDEDPALGKWASKQRTNCWSTAPTGVLDKKIGFMLLITIPVAIRIWWTRIIAEAGASILAKSLAIYVCVDWLRIQRDWLYPAVLTPLPAISSSTSSSRICVGTY